jgi:hypothetical protein
MDITNKAMLVSLTIRAWSGTKIDKRVSEEVTRQHQADQDAGHYLKKLVSKEALADIKSICGEARTTHYKHTLPWSQDGARILPSAMHSKYAEEMRNIQDQFDSAVKKFVSDYAYQVGIARNRLGSMFDESDYPSPGQVAERFAWEEAIMPIPSGNDFRVSLSKEMTDAIRQDIEAKAGAATKAAMQSLFDRVVKTVSHMAESLEEYAEVVEDGKVKKINPFRDSVVGNIEEMVSLLPALNVTGDPVLTKVTQDIKDKLLKNTPQELREDPNGRKAVAKDARKILQDMEGYV